MNTLRILRNQKLTQRQATLTCLIFGCTLLGWMPVDAPAQSARPAWTNSQIQGTPEPPLPYTLTRIYSQLAFEGPVQLVPMPYRDRMVVCQQDGKIRTFIDDPNAATSVLMADFRRNPPPLSELSAEPRLSLETFSVVFHPDFPNKPYVYVCYIVRKNGGSVVYPNGTHIARFNVTLGDSPSIDLGSEQTVFRCGSGDHNGCTLLFGNDGYLYISIGDLTSPTPPDRLKTGQDISDALACILRIDVDHPEGGKAYRVPPDNPFVSVTGAQPEVYAYGLRNPWRMSFDRPTGDLWVGDVGWEAWEMVHRIKAGGNYGWSVYEGNVLIQPNNPRGPTPHIPPQIALPHSEAASVTGGFVYRGNDLKDLQGKYLFGDWITRKFWAASFDREKVTEFHEIAASSVKPICFTSNKKGDVLVMEYSESGQAAGIYKMEPNPAANQPQLPFPRKLSESGLFASTATYKPAAGVVPFQINAPMYFDGATADFLLAMPDTGQATFYQQPQKTFDWFKTKVDFPKGTILVRTFTAPVKQGTSVIQKRIETQISHYAGVADWRYYTFQWNDDQSDAALVPAAGAASPIEIQEAQAPNGSRKLQWQFVGRNQCRMCHSAWRTDALAFSEQQLRRPESATDSYRQLLASQFVTHPNRQPALANDRFEAIVNPHDASLPLERRARSYLHANCAHCHLFGGIGSAAFDILFEKNLADSKTIDVLPMKGQFQIEDSRLIAAGDPARSILLYRVAKTGTGRMPHIGSQSVDQAGVRLLHDWIASIPKDPDIRGHLNTLTHPSNASEKEKLAAADKLLETTSGSLVLASALNEKAVAKPIREAIIERALQRPPEVAELFEPYARPDQQIERLGPNINPDLILQAKGDIERGKKLFAIGHGQCAQCHQIGEIGKNTGPNLSTIAAKRTRQQLLTSILQPSAEIAPEFQAFTFATVSGQTFVGRVLKRDDKQVSIQLADGKQVELAKEEIEVERKSPQSLMPEQLFGALSLQQAADILTYLESLK